MRVHNTHSHLKLGSTDLVMQENISLADKNWFKTGGNARFFCEPHNAEQFRSAIAFSHEYNQALFILGQGANVLVSDAGFSGLVIRPQLNTIDQIFSDSSHAVIKAGAGVVLSDLIEYCLSHNILGLEEFSGIPGTVGGSVYINVHYFNFLLEHFLQEAEVINAKTGEVSVVPASWFNFGYNQSRLQQGHEYFLLSATFTLKTCTDIEAAYARGRRVEIVRHRVSRYPSVGTCGSFFRNFHDDEVSVVSGGKKMIYVAYYLDKIGVKGHLQVGGAIVSYQHANMIVNKGSATTHDIIELARSMQSLVKKNYGIIPQPECLLIGFDEYPLIKQ